MATSLRRGSSSHVVLGRRDSRRCKDSSLSVYKEAFIFCGSQGGRISVHLQNYWLGHYTHMRKKRYKTNVRPEPRDHRLAAVQGYDRNGWKKVSYFSREWCLLCVQKPRLLKHHMRNVRTCSEYLWTTEVSNLPKWFWKDTVCLYQRGGAKPGAQWLWPRWSLICYGRTVWWALAGQCGSWRQVPNV